MRQPPYCCEMKQSRITSQTRDNWSKILQGPEILGGSTIVADLAYSESLPSRTCEPHYQYTRVSYVLAPDAPLRVSDPWCIRNGKTHT